MLFPCYIVHGYWSWFIPLFKCWLMGSLLIGYHIKMNKWNNPSAGSEPLWVGGGATDGLEGNSDYNDESGDALNDFCVMSESVH